MNRSVIIIGTVLLAAGAVYGAYEASRDSPASVVNDGTVQQTQSASTLDAHLAPVIEAARAASAQADADAKEADAIAAATDTMAAKAAKSAEEAKAAAGEARRAAAKACKAPDASHGCAAAGDGTRYEGMQSCRADGCGPESFGVFTDAKRGWESQGKWQDWSLVLGCDSMNGAITYCGQQVASAWSGYGISYNANAAAISAEWLKGVGRNPIQLDYPSGSRMRGEMAKYELDGLGVYERADKRVLRGRWLAGVMQSGVVAYPDTGALVSGVFADGNARSGSIRYRDGRIFIGEIEDAPALAQARPKRGILYAPDGAIERQGQWRDGAPVAE
jgi:hypothetical protein